MTSREYREQNYNSQSEEWHQKQLINYLDKKGIYYEVSLSGIYLPNTARKGTKSYQTQANANLAVIRKLKLQGWNNGVADIKVYLPDVELNIELKSMKGKASNIQLDTQKIVNKFKYSRYEIVKGYLNAIEMIEENF